MYACTLYHDIIIKEEGCGSGPGRHLFNIFCSKGDAYFMLGTMCNHSLCSRCGKRQGIWKKGKMEGGWEERVRDTFYKNPILLISVDPTIRKFLIG